MIVVVCGMLSLGALSRALATREGVMHSRDVLEASAAVLTALLDGETGERGFLLTRDTAFLEPFRGARLRTEQSLTRLRELVASREDEERRLDTLTLRARERFASLDSAIADAGSGRADVAVGIVQHGPGKRLMDEARRHVAALQASEENSLDERRRSEELWRRASVLILTVGTLIAGLLALQVNRNFDRALRDRRVALEETQAANERLQDQAIELEQQAEASQLAAFEAEQATEQAQVALHAAEESERERARLFDAERSARTAAESANRAKAAFLASMSHELRTPLQAALGFAQLLRSGVFGPINQEQSEALARVERSQTHLAGVIDDILDFARLEAGRVRVLLEAVPAKEIIDDLVPLVEPQAVLKQISLTAQAPEGLVVAVDRQRMRQIMVNLVGNAIKFTNSGGVVRVAARPEANRVRFDVHDNGVGIPADRLKEIFEPFVQVDDALTRTASGAGLGLAISRDLTRAMGGELTVQSEPGKGSVFSVSFPAISD